MKCWINRFLLLVGVLFFLGEAQAQDYRWRKTFEPSPSLKEALKSEDAVIISQKEFRHFMVEKNQYFTRQRIYRRIKINTEKGRKNFGRIFLRKHPQMKVEVLDARTLKKDGSVIDFPAKEIKEITIGQKEDVFDQTKINLFAIPGLEVGDEVEIMIIRSGFLLMDGLHFQHALLPIVSSKFTAILEQEFSLSYNGYNQMPDPKQSTFTNTREFQWSLKDLTGLSDDRGVIPGNEIPYLFFDLNPIRGIENWVDLMTKVEQDILRVKIRKKKEVEAWYENFLGPDPTISKMEIVAELHDYFNQQFRIGKINADEESEGIEYFLRNKKANSLYLFKIYRDLFDRLDIPYCIAIGRNKSLGPIDLKFPSWKQVTHLFFMLKEGEDWVAVVPKENARTHFHLNEFPLSLQGTAVYLIDPKNNQEFFQVQVPVTTQSFNKKWINIMGQLDLDNPNLSFESMATLTGAYTLPFRENRADFEGWATIPKEGQKSLKKEDLPWQLKRMEVGMEKSIPPFTKRFNYGYTIKNCLTKVEEDVYKIDLKNWFPHQVAIVNEGKRLLDYYPEFLRYDLVNYYLVGEQAMEILNEDQLKKKVETPYGTFSFNVEMINPNTLSISSEYILNKEQIPSEDINFLIELNKAAEEAGLHSLLIKIP